MPWTKRNVVDKDTGDGDSTKERGRGKGKEKVTSSSLIEEAISRRASGEEKFMSGALGGEASTIAADKESRMERQPSADSLQGSGWPAYGRVKLYDGPMCPPRKTGPLSPVPPHTGGSVSVPIPRGLNYVEFPRRLSAQDPEQIRLAIEDCDALRSCLKQQLDSIDNEMAIRWQTGPRR